LTFLSNTELGLGYCGYSRIEEIGDTFVVHGCIWLQLIPDDFGGTSGCQKALLFA